MTEQEAFLQAICEQPDDDAPRLMYTDWLEERGDPRGEFIRVQCELARLKCDCTCEYEHAADCPMSNEKRLRHRERELLKEYQGTWVIHMLNCIPTVSRSPLLTITAKDATRVGGWPSDDAMFQFRCGFIERVELAAADWLRHGPALVRATPLREVRVTDRAPWARGGSEVFSWIGPTASEDWTKNELRRHPECIPRKIFKLLEGKPWGNPRSYTCRYATAELAHTDLGRACIAWAREQAGLPTLASQHQRGRP